MSLCVKEFNSAYQDQRSRESTRIICPSWWRCRADDDAVATADAAAAAAEAGSDSDRSVYGSTSLR